MRMQYVDLLEPDGRYGGGAVWEEPEFRRIIARKERQAVLSARSHRDVAPCIVVHVQDERIDRVQQESVAVCTGRERTTAIAEERKSNDVGRCARLLRQRICEAAALAPPAVPDRLRTAVERLQGRANIFRCRGRRVVRNDDFRHPAVVLAVGQKAVETCHQARRAIARHNADGTDGAGIRKVHCAMVRAKPSSSRTSSRSAISTACSSPCARSGATFRREGGCADPDTQKVHAGRGGHDLRAGTGIQGDAVRFAPGGDRAVPECWPWDERQGILRASVFRRTRCGIGCSRSSWPVR